MPIDSDEELVEQYNATKNELELIYDFSIESRILCLRKVTGTNMVKNLLNILILLNLLTPFLFECPV